jgi:hypothetical protein
VQNKSIKQVTKLKETRPKSSRKYASNPHQHVQSIGQLDLETPDLKHKRKVGHGNLVDNKNGQRDREKEQGDLL